MATPFEAPFEVVYLCEVADCSSAASITLENESRLCAGCADKLSCGNPVKAAPAAALPAGVKSKRQTTLQSFCTPSMAPKSVAIRTAAIALPIAKTPLLLKHARQTKSTHSHQTKPQHAIPKNKKVASDTAAEPPRAEIGISSYGVAS